ncbi:tetratricopeptide-like helical domain, DYW domain protein [Tanacetum coccineum]
MIPYKEAWKILKTDQIQASIVAVEGGYYYGKLTNIIELDYFCVYKVVLFECNWVDIRPSRGLKKDKYGFPLVKFSRPLEKGNQECLNEEFVRVGPKPKFAPVAGYHRKAHSTMNSKASSMDSPPIELLLGIGGIFIGTMPDANVKDPADGLALGNSVYKIQFDDEFPEEEVNCRQVHSEDEKDFGQCLQKAIGVEHLTGLASPYF